MDRRRPPTCGRCWSSRSPSSRCSGLGGALPEEAQAIGRPAARHPRPGRRRDARLPGRLRASARSPARCSAPPTSACRSAAPGKAALVPANVTAFAEGLDVTEDDVLLYLALREAAHQRLFAHVPWLREHLIGAVTDYARGIEINAEGIQQRIEEQMRGIDPTQPRVDAGAARGRAVRPARSPPPRRPRCSGSRSRSPWSRAGSTRWSARPPPSGCRPRPSCRRPYAAAAPPAVRPSRPSPRWSASSCGRAGCATPRPCGARCAPGRAPRPATACGCTPTCCRPRPTSTTRSASARTPPRRSELSEDDFDAELRKLLDGEPGRPADARVTPPRRRAGRAARPGPRPTPAQATLRDRYVAHLRAHPDGMSRELPPRPPHREHAGAHRRPATGCC